MTCPTCHSPTIQVPSAYPTFHCAWCGTMVRGSEEDRRIVIPRVWQMLRDSRGKCLRDDAADCVVWLTARQVLGDILP